MGTRKVKGLEFRAVDGSRVSGDAAQRSGEIFYELASKQSAVTAEDFLEAARVEPDTSPLLPYYNGWDVQASARERWLDQSRMLMRSFEVVTVIQGETVHQRGAYYVPEAGGYVPTVSRGTARSLTESKEVSLSLVRYAEDAAVAYYRRYSSILKLVGASDEVTRRVQKILQRMEEELTDRM